MVWHSIPVVGYNIPLDKVLIILEMICSTNHLTGAKTYLPDELLGWY